MRHILIVMGFSCNARHSSRVVFNQLVLHSLVLFNAATDVQFSKTLLGHPLPFGSAGDCYSAARCPQVGI